MREATTTSMTNTTTSDPVEIERLRMLRFDAEASRDQLARIELDLSASTLSAGAKAWIWSGDVSPAAARAAGYVRVPGDRHDDIAAVVRSVGRARQRIARWDALPTTQRRAAQRW